MSVRDLNNVIIVYDCLNGQVITTIDLSIYDRDTVILMISNIINNDFENKNGIMIKYGYKN